MKRVISILIVLSILLFPFQYSYAGSVEITKEFKEVAIAIAKEEFREYLFDQIQNQDPCLGIAIYDLLGKLIYSDKYDDISCMIVESYVDYVYLLKIKGEVNKLLVEKEKDVDWFEVRRANVEGSDSELDEKTTNYKIDLSTSSVRGKINRDKFLSFSALYWYTKSRINVGLPVSLYLLELLEKNEDNYNVLIIFKKESNKNKEIWKTQFYKRFLEEKYKKEMNVRYPELIKYVLVEMLNSKTGWEDKIRKAHQDYYNLVKIENKKDSLKNPETQEPILESFDENAPISKIAGILGDDFKKIVSKDKSVVKGAGAKFLSVVSSYTLGVFDKPLESYRVISAENFTNDVLEIFESIESQRSRKGFGFNVGLWYGVFFSGQEWINEDQSKLEYPVQSFRVNDRLQYTFFDNNQYNTFVYAGGLVDMLTSNMFNKENKKFFYFGIGVKPKIFRDIAICYSAAIPPTYSKDNVVGSVISVMYDIPFSKVRKILMQKEQ